jgi:lipopolysaccharide transport system permease protein
MTSAASRVDLLLALTALDIRVRYGQGPLRLAKWFVDPIGFIAIYLVLVVYVIDRSGEAPGLSIACAVVPFHYAARTVGNALGTIRRRRTLMASFALPRGLFPAVSTLTEAAGFAAGLVLLALLMVLYAVPPTAAILWLPVTVAITLLVALAMAYPASLFGLWFPDLAPFVSHGMRALFFLASGLVALEQTTGAGSDILRLNPLTGLFEAFRKTLLYGETPAAWELLFPVGFAVLLLAIWVPIYTHEQRDFAKV